MRPIQLIAEGFGPFRERVTIDFTDSEFFALVGPTGAGKSSVIDAMCFALYGMVPRYDDKRAVAPALSIGAEQAKIALTFSIEEATFVVTRVVRRTAQGATTKECRLEKLTDSGSDVISGDARATDRAVEILLGLTPEHFLRCVVLPQGEFAKFLHDTPSERQKLLVELLGLEVYRQMGKMARERGKAAQAKADALGEQLTRLNAPTAQADQAAAARLEELRAQQELVQAAREPLRETEVARQSTELDLSGHRSLQAALRQISVPEAVSRRGEALNLAQDALTAARTAAELAETAAQSAGQSLSEFESSFDEEAVRNNLKYWQDLEEQSEALPVASQVRDQAQTDLDTSANALSAARGRLEAATSELHRIERQDDAVRLSADLTVGAPCPVCLATVAELPAHEERVALAEANDALKEATSLASGLSEKNKKHEGALARADATLTGIQTRLGRLQDRLNGVATARELEAKLQEAKRLRKQSDDLREVATSRRKALADADGVIDDLKKDEQNDWIAFNAQRDAIAALSPPQSREDLFRAWSELTQWAAGQISEIDARILEGERTAESLRTASRDRVNSLLDGLRALEVLTRATEFDTIARDTDNAVRDAEHRLADIARQRAEDAQLSVEIEKLRSEQGVFDSLGKLLSAKYFEAWVLSEAVGELVAAASLTLGTLSQGAYSMTLNEGGDFMIVDHREADSVRSAKSLSGGETFQASLALALALADHLGHFATEGAAKLESIFLDEGFGTLDDDSLEVVATALESLAAGDRMVGLVTHVKELADRVPVRYEVSKVGRTSVVERVVA